MQNKLVPQGGKSVQSREREERIRQIPVNILGRLEYRPVLWIPKSKSKSSGTKYLNPRRIMGSPRVAGHRRALRFV
jgi:hypothetical protein